MVKEWVHLSLLRLVIPLYFSTFQRDVILESRSASQIEKEAPLYDVLQTSTPLSFHTVNIAFVCVSDYWNKSNSSSSKPKINYLIGRGSHWSLLIYNKYKQNVYHLNSIKGANEKHVWQMAIGSNNLYITISFQALLNS